MDKCLKTGLSVVLAGALYGFVGASQAFFGGDLGDTKGSLENVGNGKAKAELLAEGIFKMNVEAIGNVASDLESKGYFQDSGRYSVLYQELNAL